MIYKKFRLSNDEEQRVENQLVSIAKRLFNSNRFPVRWSFLPTSLTEYINSTYEHNLCRVDLSDLPKHLSEGEYNHRVICSVAYDLEMYTPRIDEYISLDLENTTVFKQFSELQTDKYNLVHITEDFKILKHGIFYKNNSLLYPHQFLRRHFTSNFTELVTLLASAGSLDGVELRLAIDPLRLGHKTDYADIFEADYWYGPKFDEEKLLDPKYKGVVVYKRDPDIIDLALRLDRTVFLISNCSSDQLVKEIQIEEITHRDPRKQSTSYILHRYAHLLYNAEEQLFTHFDGAVKAYTLDEHSKRLEYDWFPKKSCTEASVTDKIKLFRLDGEIQTHTVTPILLAFFRYNELISEFLSAK